MSWESENGSHEGYVLPEFIDGVRGAGTWSGQAADDQVIIETIYDDAGIGTQRFVTRPAAEIIGWRVMCDCRTGSGAEITSQWTSALVARVPSKSLEDRSLGRLYVVDEDMIVVDDDHHELFTSIWKRDHVDGRSALVAVTAGRQAVREADDQLAAAVSSARAAGESWDAIGRAAGMTRQAAHERWSKKS